MVGQSARSDANALRSLLTNAADMERDWHVLLCTVAGSRLLVLCPYLAREGRRALGGRTPTFNPPL